MVAIVSPLHASDVTNPSKEAHMAEDNGPLATPR